MITFVVGRVLYVVTVEGVFGGVRDVQCQLGEEVGTEDTLSEGRLENIKWYSST